MFTFKKSERLCSKKDIELLYTSGKHRTVPPLKLYWKPVLSESPSHVRVIISVPKRQFKKAVDRNRIRRQIRQIYRLNKYKFTEILIRQKKNCDLMIVYLGKTHPELKPLKEALLTAFVSIGRDLEKG
ncbi:MAG: ribonuclease P protein component [Bacteroidia bacterium]